MIEILLAILGGLSLIFVGMTVYFLRFIAFSNRADRFLKRVGLFGYADEIVREHDREIQAEEWKKNHPRDGK